MTPLVSILIPCYNAERWISQTLRCALEQTWKHLEVIVVDDGSSDGSVSVVEGFQDQGVKLIKQVHLGASAARNRALEEARGELIQYLDADDLMSPDKIEVQVKRLLECGSEYVATCGWGFYFGPHRKTIINKADYWKDLSSVDFLADMWSVIGMMPIHSWLVPIDIVKKAGKWNETLTHSDDGEYFSRIILASKGVRFCPDAEVLYRKNHGETLSVQNADEKLFSRFRVIDLATNHLLSRINTSRTRKVCAIRFQHFAYKTFPKLPELCESAAKKARELNNGKRPLIASSFSARIIEFLFGWKTARRTELLTHSLLNQGKLAGSMQNGRYHL